MRPCGQRGSRHNPAPWASNSGLDNANRCSTGGGEMKKEIAMVIEFETSRGAPTATTHRRGEKQENCNER